MMTNDRTRQGLRISIMTLTGNLLLTLGKLLAGVLGHSAAMVADAIHSASDVGSTLMVMLALRIADRKADENHPYGHERFESLAALLLALLLAGTGLMIGKSAVETIIQGTYAEAELPTLFPLVAAIVSILVKEGMFQATKKVARETASDVLMADAWHHRSDALSSIGSLVGIAGARLGFLVLDPLAGLVICIFIMKSAWDILQPAVGRLTDASCDNETIECMRETISSVEGVKQIDLLHTRRFGSRVYVDVEISANGELTLTEAHTIAEKVHTLMEQRFPVVKHCMVHVNPWTETKDQV